MGGEQRMILTVTHLHGMYPGAVFKGTRKANSLLEGHRKNLDISVFTFVTCQDGWKAKDESRRMPSSCEKEEPRPCVRRKKFEQGSHHMLEAGHNASSVLSGTGTEDAVAVGCTGDGWQSVPDKSRSPAPGCVVRVD